MPTSNDPLIQGYAEIARALDEAFGAPGTISEDAAYRLATRRLHPLPVDGYSGRCWIRRSALVEWVEQERHRRGRGGEDGERQLGLFPGGGSR